MTHDPWYGQPTDDSPPFIGLTALLIGAAAAALGALTTATAVTIVDLLWRRGRR